MKIAFFINAFPPPTFIINQIVGLIERGHDVDIDARSRTEPVQGAHADVERYALARRTRYMPPTPRLWPARLRSAATRLIIHGWRYPRTTLDSLDLFRYRRRALNLTLIHDLIPHEHVSRKYDIIHCHFGPNGQRAIALRNAGILHGPVVTTFHGYDVNEKQPKTYGPRQYERLFGSGDAFTVGSEFLRGRVADLGCPHDRIVKLPMGVSLSRFKFAQRKRPVNGEFRLLTVARLVEFKGIEFALRAIAGLRERYPRLRYRVIGDGPLRENLADLTRRLGLDRVVEFSGALSQEDVIKAHEVADAFVLPSIIAASGLVESQSVALIEAQASGLPVIATSTGGVSESMRDGESGLLVPPGDPQALAAAISWIVDHPDVLPSMGRAGRTHAERFFDLDKLNDQLIALYCGVRSTPPDRQWN